MKQSGRRPGRRSSRSYASSKAPMGSRDHASSSLQPAPSRGKRGKFSSLSCSTEVPFLISPAQNLEHRPVWGSEVIPARLARTLNGTNELDACCFHGRSCCLDIVHPEGDHRTGGEKRVKCLLGAVEFHLRPIGQLEPRNLRFVSNGLHAHHITKELDRLFKLSGSQSQPSESFDMHSIFPDVFPVLLPASTASHPPQTLS